MPETDATFTIEEIGHIEHPAWAGWNEIYYESFPLNERMSDEYLQNLLNSIAAGEETNTHILAMHSGNVSHVLGIAYYEAYPESQTGFLWYLATRSGERGQGLGANVYHEVLRRLQDEGAQALLFEVEMPEVARHESPEQGALAERRIAWYQRQGAKLLGGVQYFQTVDSCPDATEMHVMVHPLGEVTPEEAFVMAKAVFEDSISQTGVLSLA